MSVTNKIKLVAMQVAITLAMGTGVFAQSEPFVIVDSATMIKVLNSYFEKTRTTVARKSDNSGVFLTKKFLKDSGYYLDKDPINPSTQIVRQHAPGSQAGQFDPRIGGLRFDMNNSSFEPLIAMPQSLAGRISFGLPSGGGFTINTQGWNAGMSDADLKAKIQKDLESQGYVIKGGKIYDKNGNDTGYTLAGLFDSVSGNLRANVPNIQTSGGWSTGGGYAQFPSVQGSTSGVNLPSNSGQGNVQFQSTGDPLMDALYRAAGMSPNASMNIQVQGGGAANGSGGVAYPSGAYLTRDQIIQNLRAQGYTDPNELNRLADLVLQLRAGGAGNSGSIGMNNPGYGVQFQSTGDPLMDALYRAAGISPNASMSIGVQGGGAGMSVMPGAAYNQSPLSRDQLISYLISNGADANKAPGLADLIIASRQPGAGKNDQLRIDLQNAGLGADKIQFVLGGGGNSGGVYGKDGASTSSSASAVGDAGYVIGNIQSRPDGSRRLEVRNPDGTWSFLKISPDGKSARYGNLSAIADASAPGGWIISVGDKQIASTKQVDVAAKVAAESTISLMIALGIDEATIMSYAEANGLAGSAKVIGLLGKKVNADGTSSLFHVPLKSETGFDNKNVKALIE